VLPWLMLVVLVAHGCKETLGESLWHTVLNEVVLQAAFEGHMAMLLDQIRLWNVTHVALAVFFSGLLHAIATQAWWNAMVPRHWGNLHLLLELPLPILPESLARRGGKAFAAPPPYATTSKSHQGQDDN